MSTMFKDKRDLKGRLISTAYALDPGDEVCCYYCMQGYGDDRHRTYKRGEAFLCGPEHPPCNAEANYICKEHLTEPYEIFDPYEAKRRRDDGTEGNHG